MAEHHREPVSTHCGDVGTASGLGRTGADNARWHAGRMAALSQPPQRSSRRRARACSRFRVSLACRRANISSSSRLIRSCSKSTESNAEQVE